MKYLRCSWVLVSVVLVARRALVLVKPEPRPEESRVLFLGSVGRLRAWRMEFGTGDIIAVV
jgi:hypothetical protein